MKADESVKSKKGTRCCCSHKQRDKSLDPTNKNIATQKGIRPSITPRFFQIQSSILQPITYCL
jgi:hypothetical protein